MPLQQLRVASYNDLSLVHEAEERFKQQLASAGLNRDVLFSQLASLFFNEGVAEQYAVCLVHRHYQLADGERMVTNGNSTKPSTDDSPNVVADSWLATGEPFEYRYADDPTSFAPPSADFFAKFKSILDAYNVDTLGVCSMPEVKALAPGLIFLERAGDQHDREQVTEIVAKSALTGNPEVYEAVWIAVQTSQGSLELVCCCGCNGCKSYPGDDKTAPNAGSD